MDVKLTPKVLFSAISAVAACIGPNCEAAMRRAVANTSAAGGGVDTTQEQLILALKDCVSVMERELNGLSVIQPELRQARAALTAAGAA